jgi:hypothetical protein
MRAPVEPIPPLAGFYWFKGSLEGKLKKSPGCDGEKRPWFTYLDLPPTDPASSFGFVGVVLQTKLLPLLSLQYCARWLLSSIIVGFSVTGTPEKE